MDRFKPDGGNQARRPGNYSMKKLRFFSLLTILILALAGCDGGDSVVVVQEPIHAANIFSDQASDGDISFYFDSVNQDEVFIIRIAPSVLFFGIDADAPNSPEYRAFLDFPLDGTTGSDVVPADARIVSATLEVSVNEVSFAPVVPTLIDLVTYDILGLQAVDFDSTPLLTQTVNFFPSDVGATVRIDVTALMREAQFLALPDLQLRLLLDLDANFGFVVIEDQPTVSVTAPLLTVEYVF
jgi:hypothetical protein